MSEVVHDRHGGTHPVRCQGCRQPWPCPEVQAEMLPLKPYTKYICPNGGGYGHSSHWTGARNLAVSSRHDGYCICGAVMVEEVDDGTRWRVTFEADNGFGWHPVVNETSSERDARSQVKGLHQLQADGEPVRKIGLARAVVGWEPVEVPA
jgi:hypothetical protein